MVSYCTGCLFSLSSEQELLRGTLLAFAIFPAGEVLAHAAPGSEPPPEVLDFMAATFVAVLLNSNGAPFLLLEDVLCHDLSVTCTLTCDAAIMIWAGWEVATGEAWAEAWEAWAEAWVEVV